MLKSRSDYICQESGQPCDECPVRSDPDPEVSCATTPGCTYWRAKMRARQSPLAALTFAMLIIDNELPPETEGGRPLSFRDRDSVIVDEGHNLEQQAASLFAGFTISPYSLPGEVYKNAGDRADWDDDRYGDVAPIIEDVNRRARNFITRHEGSEDKVRQVEQCQNYLRKHQYAVDEMDNEGRPWVVNVTDAVWPDSGEETKKIEMKPVDVDRFLAGKVWSRGQKRIISSATIPYRDNIGTWADRIGLNGQTNLISKPMPFDREHRLIHTNTMVGPMSGDSEDKNWDDAIEMLDEIHSHHRGENGLIHTYSYERAERLANSLGRDRVMVQPDDDTPKEVVIDNWQEDSRDILASPSMMEGVDLHGDRCRWQALLKVPFAFAGDSRVSYLLNERKDWNWYYETASMDIQQSVGRAVRGPEPEEAASYYVIDSKFSDVMNRTSPPDWFTNAITESAPDHWFDPSAAPWR